MRLKHYTDDLDSAESVIMSLALVIEARDAYTDGHCQRLAAYATSLGKALQLSEEDLAALFRGGYLHDVGKIGIPDEILLKPGRLSESEYYQIQQHPVIGDRLCGELRSLRQVRPIVRHHHERLDGSGYPDGLTGDDIPLLAQIMGIVDVYDAITTTRPYKPAATTEQAYKELLQEVNKGWRRRDLVDAFIAMHVSQAAEESYRDDRTEAHRIGGRQPERRRAELAALARSISRMKCCPARRAETLDYLYRRNVHARRARGTGRAPAGSEDAEGRRPLDVLRTLKADEALKTIPVVMLTSSREEQDLVRSYKLGANAYVVKPVDFRSFIDAVRQLGAFWAVVNEPPPAGSDKT